MVPEHKDGSEGGGETGNTDTKGASSFFVSNGKQHYTNPLWKILAAALALPLGGAFVGGIVSYRSGLSAVSEVVFKEARDAKYDNSTSLGQKINAIDNEQRTVSSKVDQCSKKINYALCYINKGKNCEWGE